MHCVATSRVSGTPDTQTLSVIFLQSSFAFFFHATQFAAPENIRINPTIGIETKQKQTTMGTTTKTPPSETVDGLSKNTLVYDVFAPSRTFCFQRVPAFVEIRDVPIVKCDTQPCIGDRKRVTWRTTETWTRHRFMPFQQRWDLEIRAEYVNGHPPERRFGAPSVKFSTPRYTARAKSGRMRSTCPSVVGRAPRTSTWLPVVNSLVWCGDHT